MELALIAAGGAAGAMARYLLYLWRTPGFPYGILVANVAGSLLLGFLIAGVPRATFLLVGVGFCGALTTFSTFALDTLVLAREGNSRAAVANVAASVVVCVAAAAAGLAVGMVVWPDMDGVTVWQGFTDWSTG
ncbi:MAG: CrcB family protein [Actinobacteria bacterium]|nr:CrcB family protein [Actinomycetota bacterium]